MASKYLPVWGESKGILEAPKGAKRHLLYDPIPPTPLIAEGTIPGTLPGIFVHMNIIIWLGFLEKKFTIRNLNA